MLATLVIGVACAAISASAFAPRPKLSPLQSSPLGTLRDASIPYYFDQLIDHGNPSLGTFKQRYFFTDDIWTGQGAPIVINNPGEQSADGFWGYLTADTSVQRALMKSLGAAGVMLEHRYWGQSSPYQDLSAQNLKYLSVEQAMKDNEYFVNHVTLPWANGPVNSHPDHTPWVNMGCSYPGVLAAFTQESFSDIFAAAWASSAPVQAQGPFWQYFEPIEEGMPKNCSSDVALAIKHIDSILLTGTALQKTALKTKFSLQNLRDGDFGRALSDWIFAWQSMEASSFASFGEDSFYQWCDAIETLPNGQINTKKKGVGMPTALDNYASYFQKTTFCPGGSCYSTYDYSSAQYTDWTVNNPVDRQWYWMVCTEFGWWQDGDPGNFSSIVSSVVTENWNLRQCNHMFPTGAIGSSPGNYHPNTAGENHKHGGWNLRAKNLYVVNGQFDPWRSASLSSLWAPKFRNTQHQVVEVIKGGHHCWDFDLSGAVYDRDIKRVVDQGVNQVRTWLKDWYNQHRKVKNMMPKKVPNYWSGIL